MFLRWSSSKSGILCAAKAGCRTHQLLQARCWSLPCCKLTDSLEQHQQSQRLPWCPHPAVPGCMHAPTH